MVNFIRIIKANTSTMKALAVIPARGGSKGIPKKNIVPIGGKPLLVWTIESAQASGCFDRIIVSSDDAEILEVAKRHGAETLLRPIRYATDSTRSEPVLTHVLKKLKAEGDLPTHVAYLQPTSPLRTSEHIKKAFKMFKGKKADALISVFEIENRFLKAYLVTPGGHLRGVSNNDFPNMNRQELPSVYMPNGAIYILHSENFLTSPSFFGERTIHFLMSPEESIDLDSKDNIKQIEKLLFKINKNRRAK